MERQLQQQQQQQRRQQQQQQRRQGGKRTPAHAAERVAGVHRRSREGCHWKAKAEDAVDTVEVGRVAVGYCTEGAECVVSERG